MRSKTNMPPYSKVKSIHLVSGIFFLWAMSDALISFYLPIQMQSFLHDLTLFGILFAVSSLTGALVDPILGFLSNKIRYVLLLFVGLLLSIALVTTAILPFSIILIIWLMAAWGLYYEFINIGIFSYVSRYHNETEQASYFGILYVFENIAYVIGPLVGGYLVIYGSRTIYGLCFVFTLLAFGLLPRLITLHKRREVALVTYHSSRGYSLKHQFKSFRKVWAYAAVFFIAAFLYNVWDSFVWTLVPIQSIGGNAVLAGIITSTFTIPLAIFTAYGGRVADHFGRNITFIIGLFAASLCTMLFGLQDLVLPQIFMAALASLGFAFAYPALMGEMSKSGLQHQSELGNIAGIQRIFINGGFVLGPIIGGELASVVGIQRSFFVLGLAMLVCFVPIIIAMIHFHIKGRIHRTVMLEFEL